MNKVPIHTDFKRILAPSSSADRFTKHNNESFDTVESLSSAKIPSDVIILLHFNSNSRPSSEPVKPIQYQTVELKFQN